jgi:RNA polymerase sigma-70 factor, ECF subfamily
MTSPSDPTEPCKGMLPRARDGASRFDGPYRQAPHGEPAVERLLATIGRRCNAVSADGVESAFMREMDQQAAAVTGSRDGLQVPLAFEQFYQTERERLFRALLLVTHDSAEAEDLMQEAFIRMWERWDRVGTFDDPVGYLFTTALNLHRSALRRAVAATKRSLRPTVEHDPFENVMDHDEAVRSLAALTPRQRAAVVVTELLGYSSEEAGTILGIRPGTVRTLTMQARAALQKWKEREDG